MKYYECDYCGAKTKESIVQVKGAVGSSGGILLPEKFHEKDFCYPGCFWQWVDEHHPEKK